MIPHWKALEEKARHEAETIRLWDAGGDHGWLLSIADALAHASTLQEEIDRLKGYVRHAPDCYIATNDVGEYTNCYRPLGGCTCGLGESKLAVSSLRRMARNGAA